MNPEYEQGKEIGRIIGQLESLIESIDKYTKKQDEWNKVVELRLQIAESWIQNTTGKVVILTTIFGIIGSIVYIAINWILAHIKN